MTLTEWLRRIKLSPIIAGRRAVPLAEFAIRSDRDAKRQSRATGMMAREVELGRTRNIGIMAHIDAGKTTTT